MELENQGHCSNYRAHLPDPFSKIHIYLGVNWVKIVYYVKIDEKRVICYFANWAQLRAPPAKYVPENIDAKLCTHIFYAFASLDSALLEVVPGDPQVDINDGYFNRIRSVAKSQNPKVKIILALGGWTESAGDKYSR